MELFQLRCVALVLACIVHQSCSQLGPSPAELIQQVVPKTLYDNIVSYMPQAISQASGHLGSMLNSEAGMSSSLKRRSRGRNHRRGGFKFVASFLGGSPHGKQMSFPAFMQTKMLESIRIRFNLNNAQVLAVMAALPPMLKQNTVPFRPDTPLPTPHPDVCPYPINTICDPTPYRTMDGCCNNLKYGIRGSAMQPLSRFVPPVYADAISAPRVSVTGGPLPSPRLVSSTIHWDIDLAHHVHTLMHMQLGQFLDHDLSRTAISKLSTHPSGFSDDLEDVECGVDGCDTRGMENQACWPIPVPHNDTIFSHKSCLMFVRSQEVPFSPNCRLGPREQLNQLSSWLDASHIYGNSKKDMEKLRDYSDAGRGRMTMTGHPAGAYKNLLPRDPEFKDCKNPTSLIKCFKAGDGRVNEFLGLTCMHTLFAREHNRIEAALKSINPHWDGERIFQETRRILGAKWQYIIYNEYLPLTLGDATMKHQALSLSPQGYWNAYDIEVDPGIANAFATAAFRFGHSQVQGMFKMKSNDYTTKGTLPLSTMFRTPHMLYMPPSDGMDSMMRGMIGMHSQTRDPFIAKELTNQLFSEDPPSGLGEDLASLNIQRAREHGIPGYNTWRQWCGLPRARVFEDLANELPAQVIERFKRLYVHVDDVDLFNAGISEFALPGAVLGPTFACIIARQFKNLKFGDRFWHENNIVNPHPFSLPQLQEIRKSSLARLICANSDSITQIQAKVLLQPLPEVFSYLREHNRLADMSNFNHHYFGRENLRVACHTLPDTDLRAWQELPPPPQPIHNALPVHPGPLPHPNAVRSPPQFVPPVPHPNAPFFNSARPGNPNFGKK